MEPLNLNWLNMCPHQFKAISYDLKDEALAWLMISFVAWEGDEIFIDNSTN